jgi:glutathione S-transferase
MRPANGHDGAVTGRDLMDIVLYYAPNTCALAPFVSLKEAGVDFTTRGLDFRRAQQMTPDYLALNPKHKVPLLLVDGRALTENTAIAYWIANTFPHAQLLPDDPWLRAQAISVHSWCASGIHIPLSRIGSPLKYGATPESAETMRENARAQLDEAFSHAETLLGGEFLFQRLSTADIHLFWSLRRASQLGVDITKWRRCKAFFDRMEKRDSVQALYAYERDLVASFAAA